MTNEQMIGAGVGVGIFLLIVLAILIVDIIALWKVFDKADKPGWHAIIPFLNIYDVFDISWKGMYGIIFIISTVAMTIIENITGIGQNPAYFSQNPNMIATSLFLITCIISLVLSVISMYKLSKSFNHGIGFTIGLILFSPIFTMILGFGKSEYIGKE